MRRWLNCRGRCIFAACNVTPFDIRDEHPQIFLTSMGFWNQSPMTIEKHIHIHMEFSGSISMSENIRNISDSHILFLDFFWKIHLTLLWFPGTEQQLSVFNLNFSLYLLLFAFSNEYSWFLHSTSMFETFQNYLMIQVLCGFVYCAESTQVPLSSLIHGKFEPFLSVDAFFLKALSSDIGVKRSCFWNAVSKFIQLFNWSLSAKAYFTPLLVSIKQPRKKKT